MEEGKVGEGGGWWTRHGDGRGHAEAGRRGDSWGTRSLSFGISFLPSLRSGRPRAFMRSLTQAESDLEQSVALDGHLHVDWDLRPRLSKLRLAYLGV